MIFWKYSSPSLSFFEFLTLIITSLRNKGHVSLIFLLSLGITSLIRLLLTYHERLVGVLLIASAILILIIGVFVLKKFVFPMMIQQIISNLV